MILQNSELQEMTVSVHVPSTSLVPTTLKIYFTRRVGCCL